MPLYPAAGLLTFNVKDYGATGNGTSDDTAAITAAQTAANAAGGGIVYFPPGTFISGPQTIQNNVWWQGAGTNASRIKLKAGANADLLSAYTSSINLVAAAPFSGPGVGVSRWGIKDLTLDGNYTNQSGGPSWCIRVYGYAFQLQNVVICNGYTGGMQCDWRGDDVVIKNTASPDHSATWLNCEFHHNNGIGLQAGGPSDSRMVGCDSYLNNGHGVHFAPNAGAIHVVSCHSWGPNSGINAVPWLIEAGYTRFYSSIGEDTDGTALVLLSNENYISGHFYAAAYGIQFGQSAGGTPYPGSLNQAAGLTTAVSCSGNIFDVDCSTCTTSGLRFVNENNNLIRARIYQTAGTGVTGTPSGLDNFWIVVSGLTPDGTLGKSGGVQFCNSNYHGLLFYNASGQQTFIMNAASAILAIGSSGQLQGYSDGAFSTLQWTIDSTVGNITTNGSIKLGGQSTVYSGSGAPSNSNGVNGDYYFRSDTPGTANQRLYVKSAGAWVGIL